MLSDFIGMLFDPAAVRAMVSWPKFSFTSYQMVLGLKKQGLEFGTIIDVGANVGQFGIACSKLFNTATVYSFEPNPDVFKQLQKNATAISNLNVFDQALGDKPGSAEFFVNSHSHSSSLLELGEKHKQAFPDAQQSQSIVVDVSTLAAVSEKIQFDKPVLLKLDVQGYEFHVIEGARPVLDKIDFIIMELSYSPMYEGEKTYSEILEYMNDLGYRALRPVGFLKHPKTDEILQMDWLFKRA